MKYIEEILPCLITMLDFNDKQIKADTCWAFSYITDGPNERIQYVLDVSKEAYLYYVPVITCLDNLKMIF